MSEQGEKSVRFIFDACIHFGASLVTAHTVAAMVAKEIERIESGKP